MVRMVSQPGYLAQGVRNNPAHEVARHKDMIDQGGVAWIAAGWQSSRRQMQAEPGRRQDAPRPIAVKRQATVEVAQNGVGDVLRLSGLDPGLERTDLKPEGLADGRAFGIPVLFCSPTPRDEMDRQQAQAGSLEYGDVGAPGDVGIGVGQAAQVRVAPKCDTCPYGEPRRLMAQTFFGPLPARRTLPNLGT